MQRGINPIAYLNSDMPRTNKEIFDRYLEIKLKGKSSIFTRLFLKIITDRNTN